LSGQVAARDAPRRSDAGRVRLTGRDVSGLLLCAEHYAAPYDLLADALDARPARLRAITGGGQPGMPLPARSVRARRGAG
jgi:hypothetical protein